mgnify:CR=1 FL=1
MVPRRGWLSVAVATTGVLAVLLLVVLRGAWIERPTAPDQHPVTTIAAGDPIAVLWDVPVIVGVDQDGREFSAASLEGRVWISNFIFTRCAEKAPITVPTPIPAAIRPKPPPSQKVQNRAMPRRPASGTPSIVLDTKKEKANRTTQAATRAVAPRRVSEIARAGLAAVVVVLGATAVAMDTIIVWPPGPQ